MLYETGDALEDVVRETFGRLGAQVDKPTERGKEDGWLTVDVEKKTCEESWKLKVHPKVNSLKMG